jgi:hypothetical protein
VGAPPFSGIVPPVVIIHSPKSSVRRGLIEVSARVEFDSAAKGQPDTLWFRFPQHSEPSLKIDPFLVALMLVAMQNGEDIKLLGSVSGRLLTGLERYQRIFHQWYPDRFRLVKVLPESIRNDEVNAGDGVGVAFSGGVDSFYSFFALRKNITHALFMAGFDMPLNLVASIQELTASYSQMMEGFNVEFIPGSTNVRAFVNTVDWTNAHGTALAASALFFRSRLSFFAIPSSYTGKRYPKWGTHPELDPLLSTEELQFQHHGAEADRVKKLEFIAKNSESFDRLRVCWIQDIGLRNCGACEKCIRTMIALRLVGALELYRTFPINALTRRKVRGLSMRTHQARVFARELMVQALLRVDFTVFFDLLFALLKREWSHRTQRYRGVSL